MRIKLIILAILAFSLEHLDAQTILAGQTTGQYIHYSDIEDIYLQADSSYTFDFDKDGMIDLKLSCFWYTTHVGYDKGIIAEPYNNTQLCDYPDKADWSIKYDTNAVIGESCFWSSQYDILREHLWYITSGESFLGQWGYGNGYFGFRICNAGDTIIGWIGINTVSEDAVKIYDYAIYSVHLSADIVQDPELTVIYNSFVREKLIINIPSSFEESLQYWCLNGLGQLMSKGMLNDGHSEIDLNSFPPGLYFCKISSHVRGGLYKVFKFIKE